MKIFEINTGEKEFICAFSVQDALLFYKKLYNLSDELFIEDFKEKSIYAKLWYPMDDIEFKQYIKKNIAFEIKKNSDGDFFKKISYKEVIEIEKITEPCIIASTVF